MLAMCVTQVFLVNLRIYRKYLAKKKLITRKNLPAEAEIILVEACPIACRKRIDQGLF
jgi:hypothetical protein